jgi:hypothetical protein
MSRQKPVLDFVGSMERLRVGRWRRREKGASRCCRHAAGTTMGDISNKPRQNTYSDIPKPTIDDIEFYNKYKSDSISILL